MTEAFENNRVILYYNGAISALTLFVQHANGSVCSPSPLPLLSSALESEETVHDVVSTHPASVVQAAGTALDLPIHLLKAESGYRERIETPGGIITVYLARFDLLDPPHQLMESKDCRFRTLTQLRGQPPAEMELLRRAYAYIMES
ncbi:hypothetical protein [Methylobacter luteus]|uniref:hypothetical protein n=1 Tax=Methylobacter luteus TaxID=415 RepID=UPI000408D252|nr:hypothetical protein [Methylobacter luteus]